MNKQQFEALKQRLIGHHRLYVDNQCTASPVYEIQVKRIEWGFIDEYSEHHQLMHSDSEGNGFSTVQEFVDDYCEDEWVYVFEGTDYFHQKDFLECHETLEDVEATMQQVQPNAGWELYHGNHKWETLYTHLTKESADNYIKAKGFDLNEYGYSDTCRLYVSSLYRNNETMGLLNLIMDGKLVFVDNNEDGK